MLIPEPISVAGEGDAEPWLAGSESRAQLYHSHSPSATQTECGDEVVHPEKGLTCNQNVAGGAEVG